MRDALEPDRAHPPARPDRATVLWACAVGAVALALSSLVIVRTLGSLLSPSCGEDLAWVAQVGAALAATIMAVLAVTVVLRWRRDGAPPRGLTTWRPSLAAVAAASLVVAVAAQLWLPHGAC